VFEGAVEQATGARRRRRALYAAASALAQALGVLALVLARPERAASAPVVVDVLIAPRTVGIPAPPPPSPPRAAPHPKERRALAARRLQAPRAVPETLPPPAPAPEAVAAPDDPPFVSDGAGPLAAAADGVVGGVPGGSGITSAPPPPPSAPQQPIPARPADLASVRDGIARVLTYPPRARRFGWAGKVLVAFTLLADGSIRDLRILERSGFEALDEAAVDAVRRAAPFRPPEVDVAVVTPIVFRLQ
jgi:protein TonB